MKSCWLFPGQGTQTVGMGKALYDASPAARAVFERATAALGWSMEELCFEGPEERLTLTANAQPAIVTASIATLEALKEAHSEVPAPDLAAGHSLGEYSALVAAGAITLEDAVRLVHLRGKAMQEAVPSGQGAMAAVMGGTPEQVATLCEEASEGQVIAPANFNAPGQIVVAGHSAAVARLGELATAAKLKAIPLKVSAPFHSSLMEPAARVMGDALASVTISPLAFPVISNVEATANAEASRVRELLVQQVDHPVRWTETLQAIVAEGVERALEIGPGKVLAGLAKRTDKSLKVLSVGEPSAFEKVGEHLQPAG